MFWMYNLILLSHALFTESRRGGWNPNSPVKRFCWTEWFDRDDPTGTGDWETLKKLRKEHPRKICAKPRKMEARTKDGHPADPTRNAFFVFDKHNGLVCRNKDQQEPYQCCDYEVRFLCPHHYCSHLSPQPIPDPIVTYPVRKCTKGPPKTTTTPETPTTTPCTPPAIDGCWTEWFSRDKPSGSGDYETLKKLRKEKPGLICDHPLRIEAQTLQGVRASSTGEKFFWFNTKKGFVCKNKHQSDRKCLDYEVRFLCPPAFCSTTPETPTTTPCTPPAIDGCWTEWFSRDKPSGSGDYETLKKLRKEKPGLICDHPLRIEAQTLQGVRASSTGEKFFWFNTKKGFVCKNKHQPDRKCLDYEVRFLCPPAFCSTTPETPTTTPCTPPAIDGCWTEWFSRDKPSGSGDYETLKKLRKEKPGLICDHPLRIEAQTLQGVRASSTGEKFFWFNTKKGFVCKNKHQPDRKCLDYEVRFLCPPAFCSTTPETPTTTPCTPTATDGCWTEWFSRDKPSGTGDYETLKKLLKEKPGLICDHPLRIEAQTLQGVPASSTGEKFLWYNTKKGFVCKNKHQPDRKCLDYEVRFLCPPAFCSTTPETPTTTPCTPTATDGCWTEWFSRDKPSGTGDYETLKKLLKEKPGLICDHPLRIEAQTLQGVPAFSTGEKFLWYNTKKGFVCKNKHQPDRKCLDYEVRFLCPPAFCSTTPETPTTTPCSTTATDGCWTEWFSRDKPSGTGDYETLKKLLKEKPGLICDHPLRIEAQTLQGVPASSTGEKFLWYNTKKGFVCKNKHQPDRKCLDYEVRFLCPPAFCSTTPETPTTTPSTPTATDGCWTEWFSRDKPSGTGDYETLKKLLKEKPGLICDHPLRIEAQTLQGVPASSTGEKFLWYNTKKGFVCKNKHQPDRKCLDYEVRFLCPPAFCSTTPETPTTTPCTPTATDGCWTEWFSRDKPSGTGDYETLKKLLKEKPGLICDHPLRIEAQTLQGVPASSTGEKFLWYNTKKGFVCKNKHQPDRKCLDYEVRFLCPPAFCSTTPETPTTTPCTPTATDGCWTEWFSRDKPSGTGDYETLKKLLKEKPGLICDHPLRIEAQTLQGVPASSTGEKFLWYNTKKGFVCKNKHQPDRKCLDYEVRFLCPPAFCSTTPETPTTTPCSTTTTPCISTTTATDGCWTEWFSRDKPSGTGDYETLKKLLKEKPGLICDHPLRIEAQTLQGVPASSTGEKFLWYNTKKGFVCKNKHQPDRKCLDYEVRFLCPPAFCSTTPETPTTTPSTPTATDGCWTEWFSRDKPSGTGDYETLKKLLKEKPGLICDHPLRIEAQTLQGVPASSTGEKFLWYNTKKGFVCKNKHQPDRKCLDYEVRFLCPPAFCSTTPETPTTTPCSTTTTPCISTTTATDGCWTEWFSRDKPSGTGDYETLKKLLKEKPGLICDHPLRIEAQTLQGVPASSTGEKFLWYNTKKGFVCKNKHQPDRKCLDYEVRFLCPPAFCSTTPETPTTTPCTPTATDGCWTEWFSRDKPSGTGDYETLKKLLKEKPGLICDHPLRIEAQTLQGVPASSTGEKFLWYNTKKGFVCKNKHQPDRKCLDYEVRFLCPPAFCSTTPETPTTTPCSTTATDGCWTEWFSRDKPSGTGDYETLKKLLKEKPGLICDHPLRIEAQTLQGVPASSTGEKFLWYNTKKGFVCKNKHQPDRKCLDYEVRFLCPPAFCSTTPETPTTTPCSTTTTPCISTTTATDGCWTEWFSRDKPSGTGDYETLKKLLKEKPGLICDHPLRIEAQTLQGVPASSTGEKFLWYNTKKGFVCKNKHQPDRKCLDYEVRFLCPPAFCSTTPETPTTTPCSTTATDGCWTEWFSRDKPSGTGDYETLKKLLKEKPGLICDHPLRIEAQTLQGVPASSTGEKFLWYNTKKGFVCKNKHQPDRKCLDYEVRFLCPPAFCSTTPETPTTTPCSTTATDGCWTEWFSRDKPSGTGDYETLKKLLKEKPGLICDHPLRIEAQTLQGVPASSTGEKFLWYNTKKGFVCKNKHQPDRKCLDYEVRFLCPPAFCSTTPETPTTTPCSTTATDGCWTEWFSRDKPSGTGDYETLKKLLKEKPGLICDHPLRIEAQTLQGVPASSTGEKFLWYNTKKGFVCKNKHQPDRKCLDYEVRFLCPPAFCSTTPETPTTTPCSTTATDGCWTEWFSRDKPSGTGDYETLKKLLKEKPGLICDHPLRIEAQTLQGVPASSTGEKFLWYNTKKGFVCKNKHQPDRKCLDYEVRFLCPPAFCSTTPETPTTTPCSTTATDGCWTEWFSRDKPSGTGDYETLKKLLKEKPGLICDHPLRIEAQTLQGVPASSTGEKFLWYNTKKGFVCKNKHQPDRKCLDYEVRFLCPPAFCSTTPETPTTTPCSTTATDGCWTEWFSRDKPSGTGDYETLKKLLKEKPGLICDHPLRIEAQTLQGVPASSTGEKFLWYNTKKGFVCKNKHQPDRKCLDYEVRFLCPPAFCSTTPETPTTTPCSTTATDGCWTEWFSRDKPSGTGDYETLKKLLKEKPGLICDHPLRIEAQTLQGVPASSTGEKFLWYNTKKGFVCKNKHQPDKKCLDYEVRFLCPPAFCSTTPETPTTTPCTPTATDGCWTEWFSRDKPSGTGDYETLKKLLKEKPGLICDHPLRIEAQTLQGVPASSTGEKFLWYNTKKGFVCKNKHQPDRKCLDYEVRFLCPPAFCSTTPETPTTTPCTPTATDGCWTEWFSRDKPSGTGDYETLKKLLKEKPGLICDHPLRIEAQTLQGVPASSTGEKFLWYNTKKGFVCKNKHQPDRKCLDYEVRFLCPPAFCSTTPETPTTTPSTPTATDGCWTEWFSRDKPSGTGDYETLKKLLKEKPGLICDHPLRIEAQTLQGVPASSTGEKFLWYNTKKGFICKNKHQPDRKCLDYEVRFLCPPAFCSTTPETPTTTPCTPTAIDGCWTEWFSRDKPSGTGDYETLKKLLKEKPGLICDHPLRIEAQTLQGVPASSTGEKFLWYNTKKGFVCKNKHQPDRKCLDYEVRFLCPPAFCSTTPETPTTTPCSTTTTPCISTTTATDGCWTEWFSRDKPSGTGDYETLKKLLKEKPGLICDHPLRIEAQTLQGVPASSTGEKFLWYNTKKGFVCKNKHQPDRKCLDYEVRFLCPPAFCSTTPGCWTEWFSRDKPSGTGDYETLKKLLKEKPGLICDHPLRIEAQTLQGVPASSTGEKFLWYNTKKGFVCKNKHQPDRKCLDYEVRFLCPPAFCSTTPETPTTTPCTPTATDGCWTEWFSRDKPSGTGDYETLKKLLKEKPGLICDHPLRIEAQTLQGVPASSTGEKFLWYNTKKGFVCKNKHQPDRKCLDYEVRFLCPPAFCSTTPETPTTTPCSTTTTPCISTPTTTTTTPSSTTTTSCTTTTTPCITTTTPYITTTSTCSTTSTTCSTTTTPCITTTTTCSTTTTPCTTTTTPCITTTTTCSTTTTPCTTTTTLCTTTTTPCTTTTTPCITTTTPCATTTTPCTTTTTPCITTPTTTTPCTTTTTPCTTSTTTSCTTTTTSPCTTTSPTSKPWTTPSNACWTQWFNRDHPSGSGDYETLTDLREENPGAICDHPLQIQAQTLEGEPASSTGDFYTSDTQTGFKCINSDQEDGACLDYQVRFQCPLEFCDSLPACWTQWFNRDHPSGSGDYETLTDLREENPGAICDHPLQIQAQTLEGEPASSTGDFYTSDTQTGFKCINSDQEDGACLDYQVRFQCPVEFCDSLPACWTQWFNRDHPSGSGDYETLTDLREENPGAICDHPLQIQAQTLEGEPASSTGDFYTSDTQTGFQCINSDQEDGACLDYQVRFQCPLEFCDSLPECWTPWYNRDNPYGTGDYETLENLRVENPGEICDHPLQIQAQTLQGEPASSTGEIFTSDKETGFICKNKDQDDKRCLDYRVRFQCPPAFCTTTPECWTPWYNRDNPYGTGDYETLENLRVENPGEICDHPLQIQAQTLQGEPASSTGEIFTSDKETGFICKNKDQDDKRCLDYRVRFQCPPAFCSTTPETPTTTPCSTTTTPCITPTTTTTPCSTTTTTLCTTTTTPCFTTTTTPCSTTTAPCTATPPVTKPRTKDCIMTWPTRPTRPFNKCWTQWFDRDDPSGFGDWETLSALRQENPGKICSRPKDIEVQTIAGLPVGTTGNKIYVSDTVIGFICKNSDQKQGQCSDYRVRFRCPPKYCVPRPDPGCWTQWFDRDDPQDSGDWETLKDLRKEYSGKICSDPRGIEAQTIEGRSVSSTGDVIHKSDTVIGFICKNSDQKQGKCSDYRVRFRCPPEFCTSGPTCWTSWFNRDGPDGTGDWETLRDLKQENPGMICPKPLKIDVQTTAGEPMNSTGDVIYKADTVRGFICKNSKQKMRKCRDYKVRFLCPLDFCASTECYTKWFNRDGPSGTGDWESLPALRAEFPGQICSKPLKIIVQNVKGDTVDATGNIATAMDVTRGFICENAYQPSGMCDDFKVRFMCPKKFCEEKVCWTPWYDRDDPLNTGDWELLSDLRKKHPNEICEVPEHIDVRTVDTNEPITDVGQTLHIWSPTEGLACRNNDQTACLCRDYKVRFGCPCNCTVDTTKSEM